MGVSARRGSFVRVDIGGDFHFNLDQGIEKSTDPDEVEPRADLREDLGVGAAYDVLAGMAKVDGDRIGVIGHCWGGRIAWLAACHNPGYKAAAVLYGGRIEVAMGPGTVPPSELAHRIPCPMIGIFGNDDENPSPADVDDLDAALTAAGVAHTFHCYDGAGHGFQDFGNAARYRKAASADAWDKLLAFFNTELT